MRRYILVLLLVLLLSAGVGWQVKASHPAEISSIPGYPCYKTIAELDAALTQIVDEHPQIAQLETIGYSYEGQPLQVIRLTNPSIPGPKPILFLIAGIHSNDAITPEVALKFSDYLTDHDGTDADATWLLAQHDIRILVSANPDGLVRVEQGNLWWQKNAHLWGTCPLPYDESNYPGVDLNQNFDFHWMLGGFECFATYHGPDKTREPETQAIQNYILRLFDDYRSVEDSDLAIENAEGIVIILQSPGERVLWPWSWSPIPAPNAQALSLLGQKLAGLNGYSALQASTLGPSTGTPLDWPYGELGIASYAIQIGPEAGGNYPSCEQASSIIQDNLPALVYAAKVARAPYQIPQGPDAFNLQVIQSGQSWRLRAVISDVDNGGNSIAASEYYLDSNPWEGGAPRQLTAEDGAFDEVDEAVSALFPASELSKGKHLILVRGQDSAGNWGAPSAIYYTVTTDSVIAGFVSESVSKLPVAGAQILFNGDEMTAATHSDEQGHYSAAVRSGVYTATVTANGYLAQVVPGICAEAGQATQRDFSLSLLPPDVGAVEGVVRDKGTKLPLFAQVSLQSTSYTAESNLQTGHYRMENIPSGTYTITASATGYLTTTIPGVTVQTQQTTTIEIELASTESRPGDLHLSLTGPGRPAYPGGQYSYTLQIENMSAVPLTGVVVTATLPTEVDFVSASPLAEEQDGVVTWILPTLDAESERSFRLSVRVKSGIKIGTTIRMDTYHAYADQIPGGVTWLQSVDILVEGRIFLPFIGK